MPRHEVAAATIAVMVEAHLGLHAPASRSQASSSRILQMGMLSIDEPIQRSSLPSNLDHERRGQRLGEAGEGPHRHAIQLAALGSANSIP
ncbi:MAG: hypothetical protein ABJC24_08925 [Chloroflexota bacterium]